MDNPRWAEAVLAATDGMGKHGARERRRHARVFAAWCFERNLRPEHADRVTIDAYVASVPGRDRQRLAKSRCAIRAILRELDPAHAARAAGLGNQSPLFESLSEELAALVRATLERQPQRRRVVASALTRLLAWCAEVDADPLTITPMDLPQFRRWLLEVGTTVGETMVVAGVFLSIRHAALDRQTPGDSAVLLPTAIELADPLVGRFRMTSQEGRREPPRGVNDGRDETKPTTKQQ